MGLACTVCGQCEGSGKTHATDTDVIDTHNAIMTSSKPIETATECPKCGKRVYPSYCVYINSRYKACVKEISKIKKETIAFHGPLLKWEALRQAKEINKMAE